MSSLPVSAEDDSPWDGVIDTDGNVIANDHGAVSVEAEWMPSFPLIGDIPAQFHVYQAESGVTMMQPDVTTLFFMAMNPHESGLYDALSQTAMGSGLQTEALGLVIGGEVTPEKMVSVILHNISGLDDSFTQELADAALNGDDAWSLVAFNDTYTIFTHLLSSSLEDLPGGDINLYLSMLLYLDCNSSPIGCLPGMIELEEESDEESEISEPALPNFPQCRVPEVFPGDILPSSKQMAPNYVLVTGQDDTKRGVDLCFTLDIMPTLYHVWQPEVVGHEESCAVEISTWWQNQINNGDATLSEVCPQEHYSNQPIIECVEYVYSLPESILFASGKATLSQDSRSWILDDLALSYPGAHLIQPEWSFLNPPALGSSHWEVCEEEIQVRDPGMYDLQVCFDTSGTAVSEPRSGCWTTGDFKAYLIQTTIIW
ncbi:MAG: hypothetical protein K8R40_01180 [Anaerolineaceae bacterium]|nr:hypothetical protein [Anaerolineaceae bacterium]